MSRTVKIILLVAGVIFLAGCGDLRWNWKDNRKRIKPKLLDDEFRQTQEYKELFDIILWNEYVRRYGDVYQRKTQVPNLP